MARTACTHFNPALGVKHVLVNVETGEHVVARVLSPKDKEHAPIRSPRMCVRGDEFFKVIFSDGTVRKVMNSLKREEALTEDGMYRFIGETAKGKTVPSSAVSPAPVRDESQPCPDSDNEVENEAEEMYSETSIEETEFVNVDALN